MRSILALVLCLSAHQVTLSDEPKQAEALKWENTFATISGSSSDQTLVVMLITNDDSYANNRSPKSDGTLWCSPLVERVFHKALQTRPELKDYCLFQSRACGIPHFLTGGQSRNIPSRAFLAICDNNYRLLAVTVGIPDTTGLLTLIEDAQEVNSLQKLNKGNLRETQKSIAQRSRKRITRMWQDSLQKMQDAMAGDAEVNTSATKEQVEAHVSRIGEAFESIYVADVKLRFAMKDSSDVVRLAILEQHPETRQPWCDAMLPFVALNDFSVSWRPIIETIWKTTPIENKPADRDLLEWWDAQISTDTVTLALQPPILSRLQSWPPVNVGGSASKKGIGWKDLQDLLVDGAYRNVDAQQLASLMHDRKLKAIDIQLPTRARYLWMEPKKTLPLLMHEGDLPAKFIGRVKRTR